jgi:hypothetical protein
MRNLLLYGLISVSIIVYDTVFPLISGSLDQLWFLRYLIEFRILKHIVIGFGPFSVHVFPDSVNGIPQNC